MTSKLIQHEHVSPNTQRAKVTIGPKTKSTAARIKLNKSGDTIESIEVKCSCGETIVIECQYE